MHFSFRIKHLSHAFFGIGIVATLGARLPDLIPAVGQQTLYLLLFCCTPLRHKGHASSSVEAWHAAKTWGNIAAKLMLPHVLGHTHALAPVDPLIQVQEVRGAINSTPCIIYQLHSLALALYCCLAGRLPHLIFIVRTARIISSRGPCSVCTLSFACRVTYGHVLRHVTTLLLQYCQSPHVMCHCSRLGTCRILTLVVEVRVQTKCTPASAKNACVK